jgi:hypothetical protein
MVWLRYHCDEKRRGHQGHSGEDGRGVSTEGLKTPTGRGGGGNMTPQIELQSFEILARFWVKAPTQEVAETTINNILIKAKHELEDKLRYELQVQEVE